MKQYLYNLAADKTRGGLASILKFCLLILSFIYGLIIRLAMFLSCRKQYRSKCRIISVGNITFGGTGKTPLVKFIAEYLKEHGYKPAILSRGYKRMTKDEGRKTRDESYENMGDEAYMLQEKLKDIPVLVGANRIKTMECASIADPSIDAFILDDGLQQWKIKKDLEIVTVNSGNPFGNCHMLPRGILRQPLSTLKKADIFVLTKSDISPDIDKTKNFLARINPGALIVETIYEPARLYPFQRINDLLNMNAFVKGNCKKTLLDSEERSGIGVNENVCLVSGIADPDYFLNTVKKLKVNAGLVFNFPDHHRYSSVDIKDITGQCADKKINTVITTEKDAVKISGLAAACLPPDCRILVLEIRLKIIRNEQEFDNRLLKLFPV